MTPGGGNMTPGTGNPGPGTGAPVVCGSAAPGTFGTTYECYGFSSTTNEVWALDRVLKKGTPICSKPSALGPIEAFAISPITGNAFIIAQDTSDFGKFTPKSGVTTCPFVKMGTFPSATVGGFAFAANGLLYAADENSGDLWRFKKDPVTADPLPEWVKIGTLPTGCEALAIHPKDGLAYSSSTSELNIVDLSDPGKSLFSCSLGRGGYDAMYFDRSGELFATNQNTNEFVTIVVDRALGSCTVTKLFSVLPANSLEAGDCNTRCAYDTCVCPPCTQGSHCASGLCTNGICEAAPPNTPCTTNDQCASASCKSGICEPGRPAGSPCTTGGQCGSAVCTSGICEGGRGAGSPCTAGSECASTVCTSGICEVGKPGGSPCTAGGQCATTICTNGVCEAGRPGGAACTNGNQCASQVCSSGLCESGKSPGMPCGAPGECVSGLCTQGVCEAGRGAGQPGTSCTQAKDCMSNSCTSGKCDAWIN